MFCVQVRVIICVLFCFVEFLLTHTHVLLTVTINVTSSAVQEDRSPGHIVLELHVTDADLDPNGAPFTFDIIAGNQDNEFRVTNDGTVATTTRFDRDVKDAYRLVIRVFDAGEPPLHSDTTVDVKIIEESAFAPTVTSLAASVTTGDAQYCDGVIGQLVASDADRYDILTYDIVSYGGRDYFSVRRQSGEIRVADCIDPGQYSINVSVTDGKFVTYGEVDLEVIGIDADFASEAVVLRFKNLTPDEFVLQHRDDGVEVRLRRSAGHRGHRAIGDVETDFAAFQN